MGVADTATAGQFSRGNEETNPALQLKSDPKKRRRTRGTRTRRSIIESGWTRFNWTQIVAGWRVVEWLLG